MNVQPADPELKQRHRAMWATGDYPLMVDTFLLPVGTRLVEACDIGPGLRVLDVAAGTGNAAIPAARRGATVTASDLTPELLRAGRQTAEAEGLEITAFERPRDFAEHFTACYGPVIAARANAAREAREAQFDEALGQFCDEYDRGTPDGARFEMEYLVAVGTKR